MEVSKDKMNQKEQQAAMQKEAGQRVLQQLSKLVSESEIQDGKLVIGASGLMISAKVPQASKGVLQIQWTMEHPLFDEALIEVNAGAGKTIEEAMQKGAESFYSDVLAVVQRALMGEKDEVAEVKLNDQVHHFSCCKGKVSFQGAEAARGALSFEDLLGEAIKARMGNKRVYLVKAFASKTAKGNTECECFINGRKYPVLTRILEQAAAKWENEDSFCLQKQCLVYVQDEADYQPYAWTKEQIQSYTMEALLFYRGCEKEEAFNALESALVKTCGSPTLAKMLHVFIPEIFTEVVYPEHEYADEIVMQKEKGQIYLYRNQLTAFDWIYDTVERTICAGYFTQQQMRNILKWSGSLNAIQTALQEHPEQKHVKLAGLGFYIDDQFVIE